MSGVDRFRAAMKKAAPPKIAEPPPDSGAEVWLKYRLDKLEQRQAWLTRLLLGLIGGLALLALGPEGKEVLMKLLATLGP